MMLARLAVRGPHFYPSTWMRLLCRRGSATTCAPGLDIERLIYAAAQTKQTGVSLQTLLKFGGRASGTEAADVCISAASFLKRELPIRFAHRIVELDNLPHGMASMSSIRKVSDWYRQSFREIFMHPIPATPALEKRFSELLSSIYERHSGTLITMARGIHEFRRSLGVPYGSPLPHNIEEDVQAYLDLFFSSRMGIRTLISHYIALHSPAQPYIGIINPACKPGSIVQDAAEDARAVCARVYGDAPDVQVLGATGFTFSYVSPYLHHICFELLKNSMRAVVESHNRRAEEAAGTFSSSSTPPGLASYPPIRIILSAAPDSEDVTIKISDEGGGIPRSGLRHLFRYFYSTSASSPSFLDDSLAANDFSPDAPMSGLGVGLPLSRVMARFWGGDLQIVPMEGFGTDAYIFLRRLGDAVEPLSEADLGALAPHSSARGAVAAGAAPSLLAAATAAASLEGRAFGGARFPPASFRLIVRDGGVVPPPLPAS